MSADRVNDLIASVRAASAERPETQAAAAAQREKLGHIAAEFESMLLGQMLRDMRSAGKWEDNEDGEEKGGGMPDFSSMFETIDSELVSHLSEGGGLGLGKELLTGLEHSYAGGSASAPVELPGKLKMSPATEAVMAAMKAGVSGVGLTPASFTPASSTAATASMPAEVDAIVNQSGVAPVKLEGVTSEFGWRRDPLNGQTKFHRGVDLRAAYGEDVRSAADGRIAFAGGQRGYGNTVVVEHANGVQTRYAHLSATEVHEGDRVAAGQVIGRAGHSGRATGTHLHFEVTADGRPVDPAAWLAGQPLKPEA